MERHDVFKRLFGADELAVSKENLSELGLTKYDCSGRTYYIFCGTYGMYKLLPLKAA